MKPLNKQIWPKVQGDGTQPPPVAERGGAEEGSETNHASVSDAG